MRTTIGCLQKHSGRKQLQTPYYLPLATIRDHSYMGSLLGSSSELGGTAQVRMTSGWKPKNCMVGFRERGYSHGCIRKAKRRALQTDMKELLDKKRSVNTRIQQQSPIRIITKCGAQWDQVKNILGHHWHILSEAPVLESIVGDRPLLNARRSPNLKDSLVHSEYLKLTKSNWLTDLPPLKGMYACGRCSICKYVDKTDVFANSDGTKVSKSVILLIVLPLVLFICCLAHAVKFTWARIRDNLGSELVSTSRPSLKRTMNDLSLCNLSNIMEVNQTASPARGFTDSICPLGEASLTKSSIKRKKFGFSI